MEKEFQLNVNGRSVSVSSDEDRPLLDVLREDLGLTGAKYGCGEGECGACTVLIGGRAERSCITPITDVGDERVVTIEGLANGDKLHAVQQAFLDKQGLQCGYCVPAQILSTVALLAENKNPSREQIIEALDGNICRCCNYVNILAAVEHVASGG
jgi:aerobic-type carbon monoxide dehydrogenase small subunit (CoxS/CutS family)